MPSPRSLAIAVASESLVPLFAAGCCFVARNAAQEVLPAAPTAAHDDNMMTSTFPFQPPSTHMGVSATNRRQPSRAPTANSSDVSSLSFLLETDCSTPSGVAAAVRLLRPLVALGLASGRCSSAALSRALFLRRALSLVTTR